MKSASINRTLEREITTRPDSARFVLCGKSAACKAPELIAALIDRVRKAPAISSLNRYLTKRDSRDDDVSIVTGLHRNS